MGYLNSIHIEILCIFVEYTKYQASGHKSNIIKIRIPIDAYENCNSVI